MTGGHGRNALSGVTHARTCSAGWRCVAMMKVVEDGVGIDMRFRGAGDRPGSSTRGMRFSGGTHSCSTKVPMCERGSL